MNASARIVSVLLLAIATSAAAQHPPAYPSKGQSQQQQGKDSSECNTWAQQTTGVNPAVASQPPPQQSGPTGERAKGAVRGAAAGAVVGEVAHGDAGKGAGTGAAVGVVAGGSRARREKRANEEAAKQGQAQAMGAYNNAWATCMKGRGYTVG